MRSVLSLKPPTALDISTSQLCCGAEVDANELSLKTKGRAEKQTVGFNV